MFLLLPGFGVPLAMQAIGSAYAVWFFVAWMSALALISAPLSLRWIGNRLRAREVLSTLLWSLLTALAALGARESHSLFALAGLILIPAWLAVGSSRFRVHAAFGLTLLAVTWASALRDQTIAPWTELASVVCAWLAGWLLSERAPEAAEVHEAAADENPVLDLSPYLELRERYRKLTEAYENLEARSERDRMAAALTRYDRESGETAYGALAERLRTVSGASRIAIYSLTRGSSCVVLHAESGGSIEATETHPRGLAALIAEHAEDAFRAAGGGNLGRSVNVPIRLNGRVIGMVQAGHARAEGLQRAAVAVEELEPWIARALEDEAARLSLVRQAHEAESLYEAAVCAQESEDAESFARQCVEMIRRSTGVDGVKAVLVSGGTSRVLALAGDDLDLTPWALFGQERGVEAWLKSGAEAEVAGDVRSDSRFDHEQILRMRIGAFGIAPICHRGLVLGYLCATARESGFIGQAELDLLRGVGGELGRGLARLEGEPGLSGAEFARELAARPSGWLVQLEPVNRSQMIERHGRMAVAHALARFGRTVRMRLPADSTAFQRSEGTVLAHLAGMDEASAESWASEMVAAAAMIEVRSSTAGAGIPLAVRAKVGEFARQSDGVFGKVGA